MISETKIKEILSNFELAGTYAGFEQINNGHIHMTFRADYDDNGKKISYLLQQVNTYVFKDIEKLMHNVAGVTEYLGKVIEANGGNPERESLHLYLTKDGKSYFTDEDGKCWRCYNFVGSTYVVQSVTDAGIFYSAAKSFGNFQKLLADYPIDSLYETIPNFHNTVSRFADFRKALEDNTSGRAENAAEETKFVLDREGDCGVLVNLIDEGKLPLRVTHNDTKLNNILYDCDTNEGICIVDLDTIMPGLSLYDYGDSIRFGASTAAEDEKDLSKVSMSLEYFEAYTKGFLEAAGSSLTETEIEYLPFSAKLMTLECGMRFLGDYINGDVYFHTEYPEHNLVRCRTQFALVADMEKKMPEMQAIVEKCRNDLGI